MSRVTRYLVVAAIAVVVALLTVKSSLPGGAMAWLGSRAGSYPPRGIATAPASRELLVGAYGRPWGKGRAQLVLAVDGSFAANWSGCFGPEGGATGTWMLSSNQVALMMASDRHSMPAEFDGLEVYRSDGRWVLLSARDERRRSYGVEGIASDAFWMPEPLPQP